MFIYLFQVLFILSVLIFELHFFGVKIVSLQLSQPSNR